MKWTLKDIIQETEHPFLNFFSLVYDILKDDGSHMDYTYYMVSRRDKDHLLSLTKNYEKVDGVVMPLYYVDPESKEISLLITSQFRPAINRYVNSFPAGLIDDHEEIKDAIIREAKEEAGVEITDIEILTSPGTTSVGISDEINSVALARIVSFGKNHLEDSEDISTRLIKLSDIKKSIDSNDGQFFFPVNIKILLLYLLERFKGCY